METVGKMETVGILGILPRVQGRKEWDLGTQMLQSEGSKYHILWVPGPSRQFLTISCEKEVCLIAGCWGFWSVVVLAVTRFRV